MSEYELKKLEVEEYQITRTERDYYFSCTVRIERTRGEVSAIEIAMPGGSITLYPRHLELLKLLRDKGIIQL
ncbi:MAG: hypothetical protein QXT14_02940 [Candidatus Bathyarchaeia archaeon]